MTNIYNMHQVPSSFRKSTLCKGNLLMRKNLGLQIYLINRDLLYDFVLQSFVQRREWFLYMCARGISWAQNQKADKSRMGQDEKTDRKTKKVNKKKKLKRICCIIFHMQVYITNLSCLIILCLKKCYIMKNERRNTSNSLSVFSTYLVLSSVTLNVR